MIIEDDITKNILELTSEDAYGSWELWGSIIQDLKKVDTKELRKQFLDVVEDLIKASKLVVKNHKFGQDFIKTELDRLKLEYEVKNYLKPDPDTFYWFESTDEGEKEDLKFRSVDNT